MFYTTLLLLFAFPPFRGNVTPPHPHFGDDNVELKVYSVPASNAPKAALCVDHGMPHAWLEVHFSKPKWDFTCLQIPDSIIYAKLSMLKPNAFPEGCQRDRKVPRKPLS